MEFLVVVKRDCETCQMVGPVLASLKASLPLMLYSQDDPAFPEEAGGARDGRADVSNGDEYGVCRRKD